MCVLFKCFEYFIICYARVRHALTAEMFKTFSSWGSMHARVEASSFAKTPVSGLLVSGPSARLPLAGRCARSQGSGPLGPAR
jgi:hypothetical protein